MKIEIHKAKKVFKKGSPVINPNLYWNLLLLLVLLVIILFSIFGFIIFQRVNTEIFSSDENLSSGSDRVKESRINNVLEYFAEKDKKSNEIISSPSPIIDPSL